MLRLRTDHFEIKSLSLSAGEFSGLTSTYGLKPDAYGDTIERGAFTQTIVENRGRVLLLDTHSQMTRIGLAYVKDHSSGLAVKGILSQTARAQEILKELEFYQSHGFALGMSIGYLPVDSKRGPNGTRILTKINLFETSLVSFPANWDARVDGVQGSHGGDDDTSERDLAGLLQDISSYMREVRTPKAAPVRPSSSDDALRDGRTFLTELRMLRRGLV